MLVTVPAHAAWMEASSNHFVIYADAKETWIRAFAEKLESVDAGIRTLMSLGNPESERSNRLRIYVVNNEASVQRLCGKSCKNVSGFYTPRAGGSIVFTPKRTDGGDVFDEDVVLFHEYGHHMLFRNWAAAYPAWYTEGFAEFVSTATVGKDKRVTIGAAAQHRAYSLFNYTMPVSDLLEKGVQFGKNGLDNDALYGRGWLLTHYLTMENARAGQLGRYLGLLNAGTPSLKAAMQAFGDLKALDRDLNSYLRRSRISVFALPAKMLTVGEIRVRPLSAGAGAIMPTRMRSDRGVNEVEAAEVVKEARRIADAFPTDSFVQSVLAEAEYDVGNLDAADAAADRAIAADPKNADAFIYKGLVAHRRATAAHADAAVWKAARGWYIKANRIDTGNAKAPFLFYNSFYTAGVEPTPNAVDGLLAAFQLAPEDPELRYAAAYELLRRKEGSTAKAVLSVLAFDPHRPPSKRLQSALSLIDAGKLDDASAALRSTADAGEENEG
ncbi:hypothetical protein [Sphingomonas sp. ID0503]|uniref:hypothetical protein n=1 Tax=Sphingomonas sp. ID0503 TaxID=3399691 RepID=UPI003AFB7F52